MKLSEKQSSYIVHLFENTSMFEDIPKHNEKYPDTFVDSRRLIFEDMIQHLTSPQASSLIDTLLKEDEEQVKLLLKLYL